MRDTPYMREIVTVQGSVGETIERIYVKQYERDEIRFSWWKDGKMVMRPLDVTEDELLPLLADAIGSGVFTHDFLKGLQSVLNGHLGDVICPHRSGPP